MPNSRPLDESRLRSAQTNRHRDGHPNLRRPRPNQPLDKHRIVEPDPCLLLPAPRFSAPVATSVR